jgi:hypothetical protein
MLIITSKKRLAAQVAVAILTVFLSFFAHQHMLAVYYERCNKNMLTALLFRDSTFCRSLHMGATFLEANVLRVIRSLPGTAPLTRFLAR